MQTRTTIACLLIVALATSIGGAIHQTHQRQSTHQAFTASQRQTVLQIRDLQLAKVREAEAARIARAAEGECEVLQKRISVMANQVPQTAGQTVSQPPTKHAYMERQVQLAATDPEYQKLSLALNRAGYSATYARFYKDRGLTPEQIVRFEDLLIARLQANYDLLAAAEAQGIKRNDPAYRKLSNPASEELDAKFIELLGEEGYAKYRKYSASTPWGYAARDLAKALFCSTEPLMLSQADKLEEVVSRNTARTRSGAPVDWNTVYTQLENVLTPQQLATLKAQRESERLNREMRELVDKVAAAKTRP